MKKKNTLEKLTPLVVGACLLTVVTSCGSDDDDNGSSRTPQPEEQQQEGQFRVVLTPVNPGSAGEANGTGDFNITGDDVSAIVNVDGAPDSSHPQNILVGTRCPAASDDTNQDGFIDLREAYVASGNVIVPLDSNLSSQSAGSFNMSGENYDYNESSSYASMLADLQLPDTNTNDFLVKLNPGQQLFLEGKVVMVHGVSADTTLPATVQSDGTATPQATLPILCGVITRTADGSTTGTTTGDTGTTTGDTGTTTGDTGTTTGDTGTTTGDTGTTTGDTGTTTGTTGTTTGYLGGTLGR